VQGVALQEPLSTVSDNPAGLVVSVMVIVPPPPPWGCWRPTL
jgi:hypothetical protein